MTQELDFDNFDALAEALEDAFIEEESRSGLSDDLLPFREQVQSYVGKPGVRGQCPRCAFGGTRVDGRGGFTCENCGFTNLETINTH